MTLDAAPVVVAGWSVMPLRFIRENLGRRVKYMPTDRSTTLDWRGT